MQSAAIVVDEPLVRRLLADQQPDLAAEVLVHVDSGWDNSTWRIGRDLAARIPRRQAAAALIQNEQQWLPTVAHDLGVPVPEHVRIGEPTSFYPWPWSVVRWLPGTTADVEFLNESEGRRLGETLSKLHRAAPSNAPPNPFRGIPLRLRTDFVEERLRGLSSAPVSIPRSTARILRDAWTTGVEAPESHDSVWIHGDLHPRNALVTDGHLVGLIDWGDLTAGDPATDLAAAWTLLRSAEGRRLFWSAYPNTKALVDRARAWAVFFGLALYTSGEPRHEPIGGMILEQIVTK